MNILLTADPYLPVPPVHYGGIERIVSGLVRELRRRGNRVGLVAHRESAEPNDSFTPWPVEVPSSLREHAAQVGTLRGAVRSFAPDVLHSFSRLAYLACVPRRLPKVMSYQRMTGGPNIGVASALAGRHLVFTGCSDFIAAVGAQAGGRWHAIPNFVDPAAFRFSESVPAGAPLVFLSRVERIKGAHTAIKVARHCGEKLLIAGTIGPTVDDRRYWDEEIKPQLGGGVEYVGPVDDTSKIALLGGAKAMIVPIEWDEPFGIVFVESLACGTPVISCRRGALPEIVRSGVEGFLVDGFDEACLAVRSIGDIRRADCRRRVEERFSVQPVVQRYEALYRGMLHGQPA